MPSFNNDISNLLHLDKIGENSLSHGGCGDVGDGGAWSTLSNPASGNSRPSPSHNKKNLATSFREYPATPLFIQSNGNGTCHGGMFYECFMNKWGDGIKRCVQWCGVGSPRAAIQWVPTYLDDCRFEEVHPNDDGGGPLPPDLPPFRPPYFSTIDKSYYWLGWPWMMDTVDKGGLLVGVQPHDLPIVPHENLAPFWTETRVCCYRQAEVPVRRCLKMDNPNLAFRELPLEALLPYFLAATARTAGEEEDDVPATYSPSSSSSDIDDDDYDDDDDDKHANTSFEQLGEIAVTETAENSGGNVGLEHVFARLPSSGMGDDARASDNANAKAAAQRFAVPSPAAPAAAAAQNVHAAATKLEFDGWRRRLPPHSKSAARMHREASAAITASAFL